MKINTYSVFPHPVLRAENDDFKSGAFEFDIPEVKESTGGAVTIKFAFEVSEPGLLKLIKEGKVVAGAFIRCEDTFFSEHFTTERFSDSKSLGSWTFDKGSLLGRVVVKPFLWTAETLEGNWSDEINSEFGLVSVSASEIVGIGEEIHFSVGQDKLKQFESIFDLKSVEELEKGRLGVELEYESIRILAHPELFDGIQKMRSSGVGKTILIGSLYLPVIMEVLVSIRDGASAYEGCKWFHVFKAKCDHLGIDMENGSAFENAQKLLDQAFGKLVKEHERDF
jgi:hypothetical protein